MSSVKPPQLVRNIPTGETGWFASPSLVNLNGDGRLEIVAPVLLGPFVFDAKGHLLGKEHDKGPRVRRRRRNDLDGDKIPELVVGRQRGHRRGLRLCRRQAAAQAAVGRHRRAAAAECPEARGIAAADLDGDGKSEVVVTTTNTSPTGSQVFVFGANGRLWHPKGAPATSWPRYNRLSGAGNDAKFDGAGNHGYGAYGENVAIGNVEQDPQLEIVVTFDNHQINVFNDDGTSMLAAPWFTNRGVPPAAPVGVSAGDSSSVGLSPAVENNQPHRHVGSWPDVRKTPWLQWTASPPAVADLDDDGKNEVIGLPNVERGEPYVTQGIRLHGHRRRPATAARARRCATRAWVASRSRRSRRFARTATGIRRAGSPPPPSANIAGDAPFRRSSRRCPTAPSTRSGRPASACGASTARARGTQVLRVRGGRRGT